MTGFRKLLLSVSFTPSVRPQHTKADLVLKYYTEIIQEYHAVLMNIGYGLDPSQTNVWDTVWCKPTCQQNYEVSSQKLHWRLIMNHPYKFWGPGLFVIWPLFATHITYSYYNRFELHNNRYQIATPPVTLYSFGLPMQYKCCLASNCLFHYS